jgi:hypothetical protein
MGSKYVLSVVKYRFYITNFPFKLTSHYALRGRDNMQGLY